MPAARDLSLAVRRAIHQPPGWESGYPRAVREALEAYGRSDPPLIPASECARAVRLIFDAYGKAGVR